MQTRLVVGLVGLASLTLTGGAQAAPLNFLFSITGGTSNPGTVTGEIFGLQNNATGAATDVQVFTATGITAPSPIIDFGAASTGGDSFTVANGVLTNDMYGENNGNYSLFLNDSANLFTKVSGSTNIGNSSGFAGATYTAAPVPEPVSMSALGLSAMALLGRRRITRR